MAILNRSQPQVDVNVANEISTSRNPYLWWKSIFHLLYFIYVYNVNI